MNTDDGDRELVEVIRERQERYEAQMRVLQRLRHRNAKRRDGKSDHPPFDQVDAPRRES